MVFAFEHVAFLVVLCLVLAFTADEEPILDLTDLNLLHVALLFIGIMVVSLDNMTKMKNGQATSGDRQVFTYVGFKSVAIISYFFSIWVVFFSHSTPNMLVDAAESLNMWCYFMSVSGLVLARSMSTLLGIVLLLRIGNSLRGSRAGRRATELSAVLSMWELWLIVWDLIGRALSSSANNTANSSAARSAKSASAATYDVGFDFEWHAALSRPTAVFFLDVAALTGSIFTLLMFSIISIAIILSLVPTFSFSGFHHVGSDREGAALREFAIATAGVTIFAIVGIVIAVSSSSLRPVMSTSGFSWL